jgi:methenyltetrahydrofolate cyclohydrolase
MQNPSLLDMSVQEFLERLGSDAPTPGGGSVAALSGALAAALGQMVCRLTAGRPKFAAVADQVRMLCARFASAEDLLRRLVEEDAAAYDELSAVLKSSKEEPGRSERLSAAAAVAAAVPFETVAVARQLLTAPS